MSSRKYWFFTILILTFAIVVRVLPLLNNNFYFTMDQGNDAIQVRDILYGHHPKLLGPETSIFGLYAGPLWYYFIATGYGLFGGHPVGPVILLIVLNTFLTYLVIRKVANKVSPSIGLLVGFLLQISWWFYDSSRYAFNPFPNTFLAFMALFCLTDFLGGEKRKYLLAAVPFGLFFHTDLASGVTVNIFFFCFGLFCLLAKRIKIKDFVLANSLILLSLVPHFISELTSGFSQTHILLRQFTEPSGVLKGSHAGLVRHHFFLLVSRSIYRQIPEIGFLIFIAVVFLLLRRSHFRNINSFVRNFVLLTIFLLATSWFFFSTNLGWRDWQTSYLSPLVFVSVILTLTEIHPVLFVPILILSILSHLQIFFTRYDQYLGEIDDPSIFANEIKVVDWAYSQAKDKGFSVYVWIPSIFDYHYQYLFWWYGRNKYGYLPCEMNTFPGSLKTYLPKGFEQFEKLKGNCPTKVRLLIMESDKNDQIDRNWYRDITQNTNKVAEKRIGKLRLEKLILNP